MLSLFGCCGAATRETEPCDPTSRCHCAEVLDRIQSLVFTLENRIKKADADVKRFPQYAEAIFQLGNRQIVTPPAIVQPAPAPIECFYADKINELVYRALTVTMKLNRNSEIVRHCLAYALATCQYVFPTEPIPIPAVSPAVARRIRCNCHCKPIVKVLQKYVIRLATKMDCNDEDLLICQDHNKATYSPNYNSQAEGQEEQAV